MPHGRGKGILPVETHNTRGTGILPVKIRHGAYLPHWTRDGAVYSVNFRLADSLPKVVLESWKFEREDIVKTARQMKRPLSVSEEKRLDKLFSERVESYLDQGSGACWMQKDGVAAAVANALEHFNGKRYWLVAWCIMPNHVHVIVEPLAGFELPGILHSWKSFSSNQANRLLGRTGAFWQPEYYDHLIRDEKDFACQIEYVLGNPARAGLKNWKWVSSGTGILPVGKHGHDGHATNRGTGILPVGSHGQDGLATSHVIPAPQRSEEGKE